MLSYLKFLLKSTNQHGVHSPFVYNYVTKCLYTKPQLSKSKVENILFKSIVYFNYQRILVQDNSNLEKKLLDRHKNLESKKEPFDVLYYKQLNANDILKRIDGNQLHNDSLVLVDYLNKNRASWEAIVKSPKITVSMDCYSLGLLFLRKEQVKEHFTIRIL